MEATETVYEIHIRGAGSPQVNGVYYPCYRVLKDGGIIVFENAVWRIMYYATKTSFGPAWYLQRGADALAAYWNKLDADMSPMPGADFHNVPTSGWAAYTGAWSLPGKDPAPTVKVKAKSILTEAARVGI